MVSIEPQENGSLDKELSARLAVHSEQELRCWLGCTTANPIADLKGFEAPPSKVCTILFSEGNVEPGMAHHDRGWGFQHLLRVPGCATQGRKDPLECPSVPAYTLTTRPIRFSSYPLKDFWFFSSSYFNYIRLMCIPLGLIFSVNCTRPCLVHYFFLFVFYMNNRD